MTEPTRPEPPAPDTQGLETAEPGPAEPESAAPEPAEPEPVEPASPQSGENPTEEPAEEPADESAEQSAEESAEGQSADSEPPQAPGSADSAPSADSADQPAEENSPGDTGAAEPAPVLAAPPARTGIAPIVNAPSGPDTGLGGFFDTLDERVKTWWATREERRAQRRAAAAADQQHSPSAAPAAQTNSEGFSLPKPPPPEQRPPGQLFTGAIPQVNADSADEDSQPAPVTAPDDPVPGADEDPDAVPEFPARPEAAEDQTTVIPPYRGEPGESALPEQEPAHRVRRELDEQRQRTVIAQKAAAIEKATAQRSPHPYGGAGAIGSGYPPPAYEFADDEEDLYTYIPPYNLPSRDPDPEPTRWDLARRITVSLGALCAVLASFWMLGWFGSSAQHPAILRQNGLRETLAEGMFSGDHALLSPDHTWYWLWPVVTVGLVIHALYQWRPAQHSTPRQRRSGWLVAAASVFMLVMTAALYSGAFTLALLSAVLIAGVLTEAIRQFNLYTARSNTERQLTDDVVGLFYGFALVQLMSTLSVWLTHREWEFLGLPAVLWAGLGLLLAVWTASFYAMTERGRITIALGLAWGLFWLIFPRILGEVTSTGVALGAALGAFIVIICTQSRRHRINHAERRAAMGRPLEDII